VPSDSIGVIAQRYALALFELAQTQGSLDQVSSDLSDLKTAIAECDDLRRALIGQSLPRDVQGKAIIAVAKAAGLSQLTINFIGVLGEGRRLDALLPIIASFQERLAAHRGEVTAHVGAAQPMSPEQIEQLTAALKTVFGAKVAFDVTLDPALIGGLVVKVGSRMIDSSVSSKLQNLKLAMKGVG
jgi:F-type H+-transporting ATPase subunit delta